MIKWIVNIFFLLAICFIVVCAGIIVFKLLFIAPCTPTGPQGTLCVADGWSIAGLAATVLGVAATVLSFIGAAAIAYWWIKLDDRVSDQVTSLYEKQKGEVNTRVEELLSEQKTKVDQQLLVQQKKIEEQKGLIDTSNRELKQIREQIDSVIDLTFSLANVIPPWELEGWAKDVTDRFKTAEAARWMVLSYLKMVDRFIAQLPATRLSFSEELHKQHAPSPTMQHYWNKAKDWGQVVEEYYKNILGEVEVSPDGTTSTVEKPEPLRVVKEKINEYEPKVLEYGRHHPVYADEAKEWTP